MGLTGNSTYSFKDLTGVLNSPLAGFIILAGGNIGAGKFVIDMAATRSENEASSDGAVMTSAIAGGNHGTITCDVQQTSILHKFFLEMNNLHQTAVDNGDISLWAASELEFRSILDGSQHIATGVSIQKTPPKTYDARGGMITWVLLAANIVNI
jgi:activator of HSP90 ATPase